MREAHMRDEPAPEERADAALGTVEELIGNDDVERLHLGAEAADRAGRQDRADAEHLHPEDVRAEVQLGRRDAVAGAVPREECHLAPAQRADEVGPRGIPERRCQRDFFSLRQIGHVVQAAPTNDPDLDLHELSFSRDTRRASRATVRPNSLHHASELRRLAARRDAACGERDATRPAR